MPSSSARTGYAVFLAITASLGGFLFGFDSAVINGAVSGLARGFGSSSAGTGFAVASILLGCGLGALIAGRLADLRGRKPVMLASAILFALTAAGAGLASSSVWFIAARFVSGLGVGAASVVCPAYIAEISPPAIRGRLASLQQMGIVVGIFAALLSDWWLAELAGGSSGKLGALEAWRWMFLVEVLPSLLFGAASLLIPESPRFLVARGRRDEARAVLERLDPGAAAGTLAEIEKTVSSERAPKLSDLRDASTGRVLPIVWIGVALSALQQLVGINTVFYYGATLWESVGFTSADALRINVVTGVVNIAATLVAMGFVDRAGRRPLLLAGSLAMALTLGTLVFALRSGNLVDGHLVLSHGAGVIALLAANLYVFSFGLSWGPCTWILLGEMFPNPIRGSAMALAVFAQWIANWLVTVSFPPMVEGLGTSGAYVTYAAFAAISFFFVQRTIEETRGRALEEM